jgi:hypothetical protein
MEVRLLKVCNRADSGHYSTLQPEVVQQNETADFGQNTSYTSLLANGRVNTFADIHGFCLGCRFCSTHRDTEQLSCLSKL